MITFTESVPLFLDTGLLLSLLMFKQHDQLSPIQSQKWVPADSYPSTSFHNISHLSAALNSGTGSEMLSGLEKVNGKQGK